MLTVENVAADTNCNHLLEHAAQSRQVYKGK